MRPRPRARPRPRCVVLGPWQGRKHRRRPRQRPRRRPLGRVLRATQIGIPGRCAPRGRRRVPTQRRRALLLLSVVVSAHGDGAAALSRKLQAVREQLPRHAQQVLLRGARRLLLLRRRRQGLYRRRLLVPSVFQFQLRLSSLLLLLLWILQVHVRGRNVRRRGDDPSTSCDRLSTVSAPPRTSSSRLRAGRR